MSKILMVALLTIPAFQADKSPGSAPYFPASFADRSFDCHFGGRVAIVSDFENEWYSQQLSAAREPALYRSSVRKGDYAGETLRFTWLRTFHHTVTIRIEGLGSAAPRLIAKQLSGAGGYDPGTIGLSVERSLTPTEANRIRALEASKHVFEQPPKECARGTDGAEWLLEKVDRAGYHFIGRWTPERGPVREFGMALLQLTGWKFDHIY